MNTSDTPTPAAVLPLPTEEQVKAFLLAKAREIRANRPGERVMVQIFGTIWESDRETSDFYLTIGSGSSFSGKSIADALDAYEKQYGVNALRSKAAALRAEADAIEARLVRFPISDETKITILEQETTLTWRELVSANLDGASQADIEAWRQALAQHGEAKVGGGAAPEFTLKIAA